MIGFFVLCNWSIYIGVLKAMMYCFWLLSHSKTLVSLKNELIAVLLANSNFYFQNKMNY